MTKDQFILAAEVNVDSRDFGHLGPMVTTACTELEMAGVTKKPEVALAEPERRSALCGMLTIASLGSMGRLDAERAPRIADG